MTQKNKKNKPTPISPETFYLNDEPSVPESNTDPKQKKASNQKPLNRQKPGTQKKSSQKPESKNQSAKRQNRTAKQKNKPAKKQNQPAKRQNKPRHTPSAQKSKKPQSTKSQTQPQPQKSSSQQKVSKEYYYKLVENAPEGIIVLNLDGSIDYENATAAKILHNSESKAADQKRFNKYLGRTSRRKLGNFLARVKQGQTVNSDDLNVLVKESALTPVDLVISPLKQGGKTVKFHILIRDISEKKEQDEMSRKEDTMNAIQHFMAGAAQEIHHPIQGAYQNVNQIIEKYKERDFEYIGFREFKDIMLSLVKMRNQMKYCFETTSRMLNLNKRRAGTKAHTDDLNESVRETIKNIKHQFDLSNIQIQFREGRNIKPVAIAPLDLMQAVNNVITNAVQSLPSQGKVNIRTQYNKDKNFIDIECRDNGVGISKETLPHIFEPFYTTKSRGVEQNSGLGLAIVYNIIKAYKGRIDVKSNLRKGTTVLISLPVFHALHKRNTTSKKAK